MGVNNRLNTPLKKVKEFKEEFFLKKRCSLIQTKITLKKKFFRLCNLESFLYKLFINKEILPEDIVLNKMEQKIVTMIIKKKKFLGYKNIKFTCKFFNFTRQTPIQKKTEDGLKYIFKKAIKHLRNKFFEKHSEYSYEKISLRERYYIFYSHYFGEISNTNNIPLECFFHFRNWKRLENPNIPKSVTKKYVSHLKLNPNFVNKIKSFLIHEFFNVFKKTCKRKIRQLVFQWEIIYKKLGFVAG